MEKDAAKGSAAAVRLIAAAAVAAAAAAGADAFKGRAAAVRVIAAAATLQLPMQRKGRRQPNSHEMWHTKRCKQVETQPAQVT